MAKQLNVNLAFTADTKGAQMQLKQLQSQLDQIIRGKDLDMSLGLTEEISRGVQAAAELKVKLNDAINVNTGKLDLTKFSNSLDRSGKRLQDYAKDLEQLGPQGTEAFLSVARAISNAETPLVSLNARASQFLTTLKNTARWQISSSVLHGFMGALQHAYGYAQDLNKSLNNIRIVTGKSSDEMARFAKEANAAARSLSATTLDYTDASLIYYQQGLDDDAVKARADVTVKLANVSRQSAEEVSNQMTAIWNNFAEGSKNLEYYADVITALGAATASSSEEIATGLEKFSAIAKTVGLSYEYATAALATITAQTRQSADTVGTGLRTLFARLESVNLGETLEDGVTLTKYTTALDKIGVSVLDQNGKMKEMDTILDEIASKWETLDETTKTATANVVGGVRQYATFLALMNNWDKMQENVDIARGSSGTLQSQADIYAESWEAASKRVSAAAEKIYDDLLNDKFFITLLNWIEKALTGLDRFIEGLGGLRGVLLGISTLVMKIFSSSIANGMTNLVQGIKNMTPSGQQAILDTKHEGWQIAKKMSIDTGTMEGANQGRAIQHEADVQELLLQNASRLTEEEQKQYQLRLDNLRVLQDQAKTQGQLLDKAEQTASNLEDQVRLERKRDKTQPFDQAALTDARNQWRQYGQSKATASNLDKTIIALGEGKTGPIKNVSQLNKELTKMEKVLGLDEKAFEKTRAAIDGLNGNTGLTNKTLQGLGDTLSEELNDALDDLHEKAEQATAGTRELTEAEKDWSQAEIEAGKATVANQQAIENEGKAYRKLKQDIVLTKESLKAHTEALVEVAQGASQFAMGLSATVAGINTFTDALDSGNFTFGTFISLITSLGMGLPMIIGGITKMGNAHVGATGATLAHVVAEKLFVAGTKEGTVAVALFGTTTKLVMPEILAFALVLAGVIAVGAGLVALFKEIKNNSPEEKLKRAAAATEDLKKSAETAQQTFDELTESFDKYEEAIKKLKELKKGTEEWNKANEDAEKIIKDLIKKYPQLASQIHRDENGHVDNIDKLRAETERITKTTSTASLANQLTTSDRNLAVQKKQLTNNGAYGYLFDDIAEALAKNQDLSFEDAINSVQLFGENVEDVARAANKNKQAIEDYAKAIQEAETATKETSRLIIDELLGDEFTEEGKQAAADAYKETYDKYYEQIMGETGSGINIWSGKNDEEVKALIKKYEWATGQTIDLASNAVLGTDSNRSFKLADGTELSAETLAAAIAAAMTKEDVEDIAAQNGVRNLYEDRTKGYSEAKHIDNKQEELDVDDDLLDTYAELLKKRKADNELIQKSETLAKKLALANIQLNQGFKDLITDWNDKYEILSADDKESAEYAETLTDVKVALRDVFGVDVSGDFVEKHLEDINKLATGDIDKLDALGVAAAQDFVAHMGIAEAEKIDGVNTWSIEQAREELESLVNWAANNPIESRAQADLDGYIESLNQMLASGQITADQVNQILGSIGYAPDIGTTKVDKTVHHDYTEKHYDTAGNVSGISNYSVDDKYAVEVPTINGVAQEKLSNRIDTSNRKGAANNSKPSGGGKDKTLKKADDEIERYHVIRETIRDLTAEYDRINKAKDRVFGANRVKHINDEIKATEKLISAQETYLDEINSYLDKDAGNLAAGILSYTGIQADLQDGILQNYEEIMNAGIAKYNADNSDNADERYEQFKKLISQYEETFALWDTAQAELTDLKNRKQDEYYERLNYVVDLKIGVNEQDLKRIETDLKILGDSVFKATERLDLLWNPNGDFKRTSDGAINTYGQITDAVRIYDEQLEETKQLFAEGNLSEDQYYESLGKVRDGYYEQLDALLDLDEQMRTYYSTTLRSANEELAYWNKQLEHGIDVLDHYKKVLELTGHKEDYVALATIFAGQASIAQNKYNTSRSTYEMLLGQKGAIEADIAAARAAGRSEEEIKFFEDKLRSITEAVQESELQMYSDLESWLEKLHEQADATAAGIKKAFENELTNGLGFDYIKSDLEKLSTIQDEYLTKTNQVYETTKFLRTIQSDMDKTSSTAAKAKLKDFQKMVEGLKEQGRLSQVELEIAKRRYEVTLAEMALEDARNAKSVVRLSRDSEGNYGYVYSADPDKINDAEEKLLDKQNDLYQYSLDTFNTNAGKLVDLTNQMNDELEALYQHAYDNGLLDTDEYQKKRNEIIERYGDMATIYTQNMLQTQSVLNEVAIQGEKEAYADHYVWLGDKLVNYKDQSIALWTELDDTRASILEEGHKAAEEVVGPDLDTLKNKTKDLVIESDNLATEVTDKVIPALDKELKGVNDVTTAYEKQRDAIQKVIEKLREEIQKINELTAAQAAQAAAAAASGAGTGSSSNPTINTSGGTNTISGPSGSGDKDTKRDTGSTQTGNTWSWQVIDYNGSSIASGGGTLTKEKAKEAVKVAAGMYSRAYNGNYKYFEDDSARIAYAQRTSSPNVGGGGCFEAGTQITMADGSLRNIEDIQLDDMVMAYNEEAQRFEPRKVIKSYAHHDTPRVITVTFANGLILGMTPGHPLLSINGWKSRDIENSLYEHGTVATWLEVNDQILNLYTQYATVIDIQEKVIPEHYDTYNIEVETCHTFVANGMVVHNSKVAMTTYMAYDTGGYTGQWNNDGKLAVLHQKELVLNQEDTANMLSAINIIRDVASMIDLQAVSAAAGLGYLSTPTIGATGGALDQNVHIEANFPGVTDHNEIEQALTSLVNRAAQFANRK